MTDDGKPFFVRLYTSRIHLYTRLGEDWRYAAEKYTTEAEVHGCRMLQHDHDIGRCGQDGSPAALLRDFWNSGLRTSVATVTNSDGGCPTCLLQ